MRFYYYLSCVVWRHENHSLHSCKLCLKTKLWCFRSGYISWTLHDIVATTRRLKNCGAHAFNISVQKERVLTLYFYRCIICDRMCWCTSYEWQEQIFVVSTLHWLTPYPLIKHESARQYTNGAVWITLPNEQRLFIKKSSASLAPPPAPVHLSSTSYKNKISRLARLTFHTRCFIANICFLKTVF